MMFAKKLLTITAIFFGLLIWSLGASSIFVRQYPVVSFNQKLSGINQKDSQLATKTINRYLNTRRPTEVMFLNLGSFLSTDELSHLSDLRRLLVKFDVITFLGTIFIIAYLFNYYLAQRPALNLIRLLSSAGAAVVGVGLLAILSSVLIFKLEFNFIHRLIFPQGNFEFPSNSALIQLFPEKFWQITIIELAVTVIIISSLIILGCRIVMRSAHSH